MREPVRSKDLAKLVGIKLGKIQLEIRSGNTHAVFYDERGKPILCIPHDYLFDGEGNYYDLDELPDMR